MRRLGQGRLWTIQVMCRVAHGRSLPLPGRLGGVSANGAEHVRMRLKHAPMRFRNRLQWDAIVRVSDRVRNP